MRKVAGLFLIHLLIGAKLWAQPTEVYYLRADIEEPWCCGWAPYPDANPNGFDYVFGAGGWNLAFYESASADAIFSDNTCYVYLEGGDGHAEEMETFFDAHQSLIEDWVNNGGSLFLNAAPNEGDGMNYGFGGVWLWYPYWWAGDVTAAPGMASHPIFTGPYTPVCTDYYGTSFTHAYTSGPDLTPIIDDYWYANYPALTTKTWGAGTVFFGSMTTASWHYPSLEAANLRNNMHAYLYSLCSLLLPVEFTSFEAYPDGSAIELNWTVADEMEVTAYTIERSLNGIEWETIEVVDLQDPTQKTGTYTRTDNHPMQGLSYYQIKMVMGSDHFGYSTARKVELNGEMTLYPNPTREVLYLSTDGSAPEQIRVYNAAGEAMNIETCFNHGITALRLAGLPPGIYTMVAVFHGVPEARTFVKS